MKHWVFDLDGTLTDSFAHYFAFLKEIFDHHGIKFEPKHRLQSISGPVSKFFEENIGAQHTAAALSKLQERTYADAFKIRTFEGIYENIQALTKRGDRVAVWTSRDLKSAGMILRGTGLENHVELCIGGDSTINHKPNPEGLLRVLEHFGCEAREVTMVGDHEHDMMAAKAVGARGVRASWHSYWEIEKCRHADHQFYSVKEFSGWWAGKPRPH